MPRDFDPKLDYYEILQVHPKAQPEMIKRAYRLLLREMKAHPDLGGSHQQAVIINEAYAVLSDQTRRAAYDLARAGVTGQAPPPPRRPEPAESYSAAPVIVVCRTCGRKNRLPGGVSLGRARCGACGSSLSVTGASHPPRPPSGENRLRLPQALYQELVANSQLVLRVDRLKRGGRIVCRKCRQPWSAGRGEPVPPRCPACRDKEWNAFRLFKCGCCGHEFRCNSLKAYPYLIYPRCPACQSPRWNKTCERGTLRRLLSLFFK